MTERVPMIVNMYTASEIAAEVPAAWTNFLRALTPAMKDAGPGRFGMGRLGMNARRVPPGHSACPAHTHLMADEIFVVLEGQVCFATAIACTRSTPETAFPVRPTQGIAHQIANPATPDGTATWCISRSVRSRPGMSAHTRIAARWSSMPSIATDSCVRLTITRGSHSRRRC